MREAVSKRMLGGSTNKSNARCVDVDTLLRISKTMHAAFVETFRGIPLRIDPALEGNEWYCAVSEKLFEEIKKQPTSSADAAAERE